MTESLTPEALCEIQNAFGDPLPPHGQVHEATVDGRRYTGNFAQALLVALLTPTPEQREGVERLIAEVQDLQAKVAHVEAICDKPDLPIGAHASAYFKLAMVREALAGE